MLWHQRISLKVLKITLFKTCFHTSFEEDRKIKNMQNFLSLNLQNLLSAWFLWNFVSGHFFASLIFLKLKKVILKWNFFRIRKHEKLPPPPKRLLSVRLSRFSIPKPRRPSSNTINQMPKKLCHRGTIHPFNYLLDHKLKFVHFRELPFVP